MPTNVRKTDMQLTNNNNSQYRGRHYTKNGSNRKQSHDDEAGENRAVTLGKARARTEWDGTQRE
ncbi:uncharacterized protein APUU_40694A [Aspergillus puulaauensis]|uniref:Uncharacterized protein n=1 Tax=Aspergillus puulaauensis TaxID=1220207 RepID=A0A7R8AP53_9EURO|nr:uncharacterized protein APUU_40694A [Aspergillus puulaauensis]BCS24250.1 hypothetical protein APUU_40694A [Aspergillus puulaauensis]